jgi:hypothetical protein
MSMPPCRNRERALAAGRETYLGRPCKNGHRRRNTQTHHCIECRRVEERERIRQRRLADPAYREREAAMVKVRMRALRARRRDADAERAL